MGTQHMLLQLSLIKTRQGKDENADRQSAGEKEDEISPYSAGIGRLKHIASLSRVAGEYGTAEIAKEDISQTACQEPELLVRWLEAQPKRRYISLLADLMDEDRPCCYSQRACLSCNWPEAVSAVSQEYSTGLPTSISLAERYGRCPD